MKMLLSFPFGIVVGYLIFSKNHKSESTSNLNLEAQRSVSDDMREECMKRKDDLSYCERRETDRVFFCE
jgi:hypothetical protein